MIGLPGRKARHAKQARAYRTGRKVRRSVAIRYAEQAHAAGDTRSARAQARARHRK